MTDSKATHILFLLDRSGSMDFIKQDVIGGFNSFLDEQKADATGELFVSLIQFDSSDPFEVVTERTNINDILKLDENIFVPRGGTPLLDAIGETVDWGEKEAIKPDDNVVLVIFTDGQENMSRKKNRGDIKELLEQKQDEGWTVVYLGANQDAYSEASSFGTQATNTSNYVADSYGIASAFGDISRATLTHRAKGAGGQSVGGVEYDFYAETGKEADEDHKARS